MTHPTFFLSLLLQASPEKCLAHLEVAEPDQSEGMDLLPQKGFEKTKEGASGTSVCRQRQVV